MQRLMRVLLNFVQFDVCLTVYTASLNVLRDFERFVSDMNRKKFSRVEQCDDLS